jgi:hypothetical protein
MNDLNLTWNSNTAGMQWQPVIKNMKRITKTVDKYDSDGKLIGREVIVEEYEDIQKEVWEQVPSFGNHFTITSANEEVTDNTAGKIKINYSVSTAEVPQAVSFCNN